MFARIEWTVYIAPLPTFLLILHPSQSSPSFEISVWRVCQEFKWAKIEKNEGTNVTTLALCFENSSGPCNWKKRKKKLFGDKTRKINLARHPSSIGQDQIFKRLHISCHNRKETRMFRSLITAPWMRILNCNCREQSSGGGGGQTAY